METCNLMSVHVYCQAAKLLAYAINCKGITELVHFVRTSYEKRIAKEIVGKLIISACRVFKHIVIEKSYIDEVVKLLEDVEYVVSISTIILFFQLALSAFVSLHILKYHLHCISFFYKSLYQNSWFLV